MATAEAPRPTTMHDPNSNHPLHRLTPEQIQELGEKFQQIGEETRASLGASDARSARTVGRGVSLGVSDSAAAASA